MTRFEPADRLPLHAHPHIRTKSVDKLEEAVAQYYHHVRLNLPKGAKGFDVVSNHCELQSIGLTYARHNAPINIAFPPRDFFGQLIAYKGGAEVNFGGARVEVAGSMSAVASVDDPLDLRLAADFEQLVLKIAPSPLVSKLEAITGRSAVAPLKFKAGSSLVRPECDLLRRMHLFLIDRLDSKAQTPLHPLALAEFEQAVMVAFLCSNDNSHTHLLNQRPLQPAPWQVRQAEEYIEAHWDQPITVEALTIVTGASARSIFHFFKKSRGYSPMDFVRKFTACTSTSRPLGPRLRRARWHVKRA